MFSESLLFALAAEKLPEGLAWQYELKLDGYRAIGVRTKTGVELWSRNKRDFSRRFPIVARALLRHCRRDGFEDRIFRVAHTPVAERDQPYGYMKENRAQC